MKKRAIWITGCVALLCIYIVLTVKIFMYRASIKALHQEAQNVSQPSTTAKQIKSKVRTVIKKENRKKVSKLENKHQVSHSNVDEYQKKLEENPESASAHYQLALAYMTDKTTEKKAIRHLEKVISINPQDPRKPVMEIWMKKLKGEQQ